MVILVWENRIILGTIRSHHGGTMKRNDDVDPKKMIIVLLEQLGFECVSHPSSLNTRVYVKDNLVVHIDIHPMK